MLASQERGLSFSLASILICFYLQEIKIIAQRLVLIRALVTSGIALSGFFHHSLLDLFLDLLSGSTVSWCLLIPSQLPFLASCQPQQCWFAYSSCRSIWSFLSPILLMYSQSFFNPELQVWPSHITHIKLLDFSPGSASVCMCWCLYISGAHLPLRLACFSSRATS